MDNETVFDRYVEKIKNNKFLAVVFIVCAAIGGAATLKESIGKLVSTESPEKTYQKSVAPSKQEGIESKVRQLIVEQFNIKNGDESSFTRSSKLSSIIPFEGKPVDGRQLSFWEFVMALDEEFHLDIPDEDAKKWETVGDVIAYVEKSDEK